jgi:hypothetical protein
LLDIHQDLDHLAYHWTRRARTVVVQVDVPASPVNASIADREEGRNANSNIVPPSGLDPTSAGIDPAGGSTRADVTVGGIVATKSTNTVLIVSSTGILSVVIPENTRITGLRNKLGSVVPFDVVLISGKLTQSGALVATNLEVVRRLDNRVKKMAITAMGPGFLVLGGSLAIEISTNARGVLEVQLSSLAEFNRHQNASGFGANRSGASVNGGVSANGTGAAAGSGASINGGGAAVVGGGGSTSASGGAAASGGGASTSASGGAAARSGSASTSISGGAAASSGGVAASGGAAASGGGVAVSGGASLNAGGAAVNGGASVNGGVGAAGGGKR